MALLLMEKRQENVKICWQHYLPRGNFKVKYGADILRLWVASSDYAEDLRIDHLILEQHAESYRKIRNTFRFMLGI